jgi:hypothetical protein
MALLAMYWQIKSKAEGRNLTLDEKHKKDKIVGDLEKMILLEEISWHQKSWALWLKEGDKNIKFFHRLANSNRMYNSIHTLSINGVMSTVPNDIVEIITQFYINLYTEEVDWRPKLDGLEFSMISEEDAIWLERSFEQDEVEGMLKHFNGDKAPRPDGFPMSFY